MVSAALPDFGVGSGCWRDVYARLVKRQAQLRRQLAAEFQISVGLRSAQAVVQMRGMEHEPQLSAARRQNAQSATESAPPESATASRMPGLSSAVSSGR